MGALGWIAARLAALEGDDAAARRLGAFATFWLKGLGARAIAAGEASRIGHQALAGIRNLSPVVM